MSEHNISELLTQAQTTYMYGVALLTAKIVMRLAPDQRDAYLGMCDTVGKLLDDSMPAKLDSPEDQTHMRELLVSLHDQYVAELLDS